MGRYFNTSSTSVEVVITSLAGNLIAQFEKPRATTIGHLKSLVGQCSGIPACEQRLVQLHDAGEILADSIRLEELNAGDTIELSLVRVPKRWAVTGDYGGSLCVWDLDEQLCEKVLETRSPLSALAVDWSSRLALCGSATGELGLWDLGRGCCLRELRCSSSSCSTTSSHSTLPCQCCKSSCASSSSSSSTSSTSSTSTSSSCSTALPASVSMAAGAGAGVGAGSGAGTICCSATRIAGRVKSLELDWQSRLATSVSVGERCARLWDLNSGRCIQELLEVNVNISHISTDWRHMISLTGGEEGTLCLWDLQSGACIWRQHSYRALRHLSMDWKHHRCLVVGVPDSSEVRGNASGVVIDLWTFETDVDGELAPPESVMPRVYSYARQTLQSVPGPAHAPLHIRPDRHWSRFLKLAGGHSRAYLSELLLDPDEQEEEEEEEEKGDSYSGKVNDDMRPPAAPSKDIDFEEAASCLAWDSEETSILAGGTSGLLWLVDVESCSIMAELEGHTDEVTCLAVS